MNAFASHTRFNTMNTVVCIPVRNEAANILPCLQAFAGQDYQNRFDVLLLLNNCTDATALLAASFSPPPLMGLHLVERLLPEALANAGNARRLAMKAGRRLAGTKGVLLCTDADAVVPSDWISQNLRLIDAWADAVAGQIEMDPQDAARLPKRMHEDEAAAQLLTRLLDEMDSIIDPDLSDPWPRHAQHSGASIAVTCAAYDAVGGIPAIRSSEDRAFFAALRSIDARIRHAPEIIVSVSGRLEGRAIGGMAETLRRRLAAPDRWLDNCIEAARARQRRATTCRSLRAIHAKVRAGQLPWTDLQEVADRLQLSPAILSRMSETAPAFGAFWQWVERKSLPLRYHRVRASAVDAEIAAARSIIRLYGGTQQAGPFIVSDAADPTAIVDAGPEQSVAFLHPPLAAD